MECNSRGSEWRKWDLHIHSNASDGKLSPQEIIDIAEEEELAVIAITDHHTVSNVDETKRLGREKGITVITGIEFRTEYGAHSVHIIGLLPDEYNGIKLTQDAVEQLILSKLNLSRVYIESVGKKSKAKLDGINAFKEGMNKVQVDLKTAANLIHEYGGLVTVHSGKKSNSIEQMHHEGPGVENVKDVVDSLGPVKEELLNNYIDVCEIGSPTDKNAEFYIKQFNIPVITASDAHDKNRLGKIFTWIKADPTFEGLRQIKFEPELRVRIQSNIPEMKADYQVIESIDINHPDFGNQKIIFNPNLNTIIGGRSSGKSILLGVIAKLANYVGDIKDKPEYNEYIDTIVKSMRLNWMDNDASAIRKVEYFPQTYINSLASDSRETIKLIEDILKDDIDRKNAFEEYDSENSKNIVNITNAIENLMKLHYKAEEASRESISIGDIAGIKNEIKKLETKLDELRNKSILKLTEEEEKAHLLRKEEKFKLLDEILRLSKTQRQLIQLSTEDLVKDIGGELVGLPDDIRDAFSNELKEISKKVGEEWKAFVYFQLAAIDKKVEDINGRISEIENSNEYITGELYFENNKAIKEIINALDAEKIKEKKIIELLNIKKVFDEEIEKQKYSIFNMQKTFMNAANKICEKVKMEKDEITITPCVEFNADVFFSFIDESFIKKRNAVKNFQEYEYKNIDDFIDMLSDLLNRIELDQVKLKNGRDKKQVILSLLSTNYFKLQYNVEYQGDNLDSMSEGKKAFVILRMLLDFNDNKCPILIDQPEDDLDNRAIYNDLVEYIRKKKGERQIILVTHNPNIVVAADAEEVIVANQNGIHNENRNGVKFSYCSGAIENSFKDEREIYILEKQGIREHICEILEGGDVAFLKRENKYCLNA